MSELESCVLNLEEVIRKHDNRNCNYLEAKYHISNISKYFEYEVTNAQLEFAVSSVFDKDKGVLKYLEKTIYDKQCKDAKSEAFKLINSLIAKQSTKLDQYVVEIKQLCLKYIGTDGASQDREQAFDVLLALLENCHHTNSDLQVTNMTEVFLKQVSSKPSPKVCEKLYHLLGVLAKKYPECMLKYQEKVLRLFLSVLKSQMQSAKAVSFPIIAGCVKGLTAFMFGFSQSPEDSAENNEKIYTALKILCDPETRVSHRVAQRAALDLITQHCDQLADRLYSDCKLWLKYLKQWAEFSNRDDHRAGVGALYAFLRIVAQKLTERNERADQANFQYFVTDFKNCMQKTEVKPYELGYAIKGFGLFSAACKVHMEVSEVSHMFSLMMQRSEQSFMMSFDISESMLNQLPNYIESLGTIMGHLEIITEEQIISLQGLAVLLIEKFPRVTYYYHFACYRALLLTCYNLGKSGTFLDNFLEGVVYQGIIRTCSHPPVDDVELQKEQMVDTNPDRKIETYKSYLPLWNTLLRPTEGAQYPFPTAMRQAVTVKLYDHFISSVLLIIEKLDLRTRVVDSPENIGDGGFEITITSSDPESTMQAITPKDFQVFINLVDFCSEVLPKANMELFEKWVQHFSYTIIKHSSEKPIVSGFYKLLCISLEICRRLKYFKGLEDGVIGGEGNITSDSRQQCFEVHLKFMQELLVRLKQYKNRDLLLSCLKVVLAAPVELVIPLLPLVTPALKEVFSIGRSYIPIALLGIDALEKWNTSIPQDTFSPLLKEVLPSLDAFLCSRGFSGDPDVNIQMTEERSRRGTRKVARKKLKEIQNKDTQLSKLQNKIICFLGNLSNQMCLSLLKVDMQSISEEAVAWDSNTHLKFSVPFTDIKPSIYLDKFLPRIVELALNSSDRRTRVSACELLHAVVMFMLGTGVQLAKEQIANRDEMKNPDKLSKIFGKLLLPVIKLGCDPDQVVRQLFYPLVLQLTHWYSSKYQLRSQESSIMIETLLEGVTHPTDSAVRDFSAKCLKEFVTWSIKQLSAKELEAAPINIKSILKRIYSFSLHPSPSKRYGAAFALNNLYTTLREEQSIIDQFWFELLYHFVKCLALSEEDDSALGTKEQVSQALDHIERVLREKADLFNKSNRARRKPAEFDGVVLKDAVNWLFEKCGSIETEGRHRCMAMVYSLGPHVKGCNHVTDFIELYLKEHGENALLNIIEAGGSSHRKGIAQIVTLQDLDGSGIVLVMYWLKLLLSALDSYHWLFERTYIKSSRILKEEKHYKLLESVRYFIDFVSRSDIDSAVKLCSNEEGTSKKIIYSPREQEKFIELKCTILVRLFNFLVVVMNNNDADALNQVLDSVWGEKLWTIIVDCVFQPTELGFNMKNRELMQQLPGEMRKLLKSMKEKVPAHRLYGFYNSLSSFFKENCQILKDLPVMFKKGSSLRQNLFVEGCEILQKTGMLENIAEIEVVLGDSKGKTLIENIFKALAGSSCEEALELQPLAQKYGEKLLQLSLLLDDKVELLINLITDEKMLKTTGTLTSVTHGAHMLSTFKRTIFTHLLKSPEKAIPLLVEKTISGNAQQLDIITSLVQHLAKNRDLRKSQGDGIVKAVLACWKDLEVWSGRSEDRRMLLLNLVCQLVCIRGNAVSENEKIKQWIFKLVANPQYNLGFKKKCLDLLPFLTNREEDQNPSLEVALNGMKSQNIPLTSREFPLGSLEYSEYVSAFTKVLESMTMSGSRILLKFLLSISVADNEHRLEAEIQKHLLDYMKRLNTSHQLKSIQVIYKEFLDEDNMPEARLEIVQRFVISLLRSADSSVVESFFAEIIRSPIIRTLEANSERKVKHKLQHQLVSKIGNFNMLEMLFSKLSKEHFTPEGKGKVLESYGSTDLVKNLCSAVKVLFETGIDTTSELMNDDNVMELYRKCFCSAYNARAAIVSNMKNEEKFYVGFLFKMIPWDKFVNTSTTYVFPVLVEEIPERRKKFVLLRRGARDLRKEESEGEVLNPSLKYIPTQYLFNSTLNEDVTQFDFSYSLVKRLPIEQMSGEQSLAERGEQNSVHQIEVTLEDDSINNHECMATICGVIRHMEENNIYKKSEGENPPLPAWMNSIKDVFENVNTHKNVKVFLAKMILNVQDIFRPYAKHWLIPITQVIVDKCFGEDINYVVADMVSMLLSWHEVSIPSVNSVVEKQLASELLAFLVATAGHDRRDVFRHNLDLMKTLLEVWKPCLEVPHQLLFNKLHAPSANKRDHELAIQFTAILVANEIEPWSSTGKARFLQVLLKCLDSGTSDVYLSAAEVVGMILKYLDKEESIELTNEEDATFLKNVKAALKSLQKTKDKFFTCLYGIQKHYSIIGDSFLNTVLFDLPRMYGYYQMLGLKIILLRVEAHHEIYRELMDKGLTQFISNRDVDSQEVSLQIVRKLGPTLTPEQFLVLLKELSKFTSHKNVSCRSIMYDILKWSYEKYSDCDEQEEAVHAVKEESRRALLEGLVDTNKELQNKTYEFFSSKDRLPSDTSQRLLSILSEMYHPATEQNFLGYGTCILLEAAEKTPDFTRKIFEHPLIDCKFEPYHLLTSWRAQHASMAPLFAETLASQLSQPDTLTGSLSDQSFAGRLRATQRSLAFQPTAALNDVSGSANTLDMSFGDSSFSADKSSLLFTMGSLSKTPRLAGSTSRYTASDTSTNADTPLQPSTPSPLKRRFLKDEQKRRYYFASQEVKRGIRREELKQERKIQRERQINVSREYRIGDFPDIEIPHSAILVPLKNLVKRDAGIAKQAFVSLFDGIYEEVSSEENRSEFLSKATGCLNRILENTSHCTPAVMGAILEVGIAHVGKIPLTPEHVSIVSKTSGHTSLGIILLEEQIIEAMSEQEEKPQSSKRARMQINTDETKDLWLLLAQLYKTIDEYDVLRGIYHEKLNCPDEVKRALDAETAGNWSEAKTNYLKVLKMAEDSEEFTDIEQDQYTEAYYKSLASLSEWENLDKTVKTQISNNFEEVWSDSWKQDFLFPWLVSTQIHLLLNNGGRDSNQFCNFMQTCWKDEVKRQHLKNHFSEELAALCIKNGTVDLAKYHTNVNFSLFLEEWSYLNRLAYKVRASKLQKLQRVAELQNCISVATITDPQKHLKNISMFITLLSRNLPCHLDSLNHWETRLFYRSAYLNLLKKELEKKIQPGIKDDQFGEEKKLLLRIKQDKVSMWLSLVELAVSSNNFHVAKKYIQKTCELQASDDTSLKVQWQLGLCSTCLCRATVAAGAEKMQSITRAWESLDPVVKMPKIEDPLLNIQLTKCLYEVTRKVADYLHTKESKDCASKEYGSIRKRLKVSSEDPEELLKAVEEYAFKCLKKAVTTSEEGFSQHSDSPGMETCLASAHLQLAKYCKRALERCESRDQRVTYGRQFVKSILNAMKHGSQEARQLFSVLLQLPELAEDLSETFKTESATVPEWMFLGWTNQILACLDSQIANCLEELILRLAKSYPRALYFPFQLSCENYKFQPDKGGQVAENIVQRLKAVICCETLMETVLKALGYVCAPETLLSSQMENLGKAIRSPKSTLENLKASVNASIEEMYGNEKVDGLCIIGKEHGALKDFKPKFQSVLSSKNLVQARDKLKHIHKDVQEFKEARKAVAKACTLKEYSEWLSEFQSLKYTSSVEIPGQYTGEAKPLPQYHVTIAGFGQTVTVLESIRKPIRLTILGNDGQEHKYLVKRGEDLRQDQRIEQLFGIMNNILEQDSVCNERQLSIFTYKVMPLNTRVGLIEWVDDTVTLKRLIDCDERVLHQRAEKELGRCAVKDCKIEELANRFRRFVNQIPWNLLRKAFLSRSSSPEGFVLLRQNFLTSHAVVCISQWLLGIGDRHLSNFLVSEKTGKVIGIDFGHAFGTATQFLGIPELIPFRLTPQIVNLMKPLMETGLLKETMVHTLQALRTNHDVLLATMEVFVQEPSVDWMDFAYRQHVQQTGKPGEESDYLWYPREKIQLARLKFEGDNPASIMEEELEAGHGKEKVFCRKVRSIVSGSAGDLRAQMKGKTLTAQQQVECLVEQAMDFRVLGATYLGWEPWL